MITNVLGQPTTYIFMAAIDSNENLVNVFDYAQFIHPTKLYTTNINRKVTFNPVAEHHSIKCTEK